MYQQEDSGIEAAYYGYIPPFHVAGILGLHKWTTSIVNFLTPTSLNCAN